VTTHPLWSVLARVTMLSGEIGASVIITMSLGFPPG
jgi:hypothetical protein